MLTKALILLFKGLVFGLLSVSAHASPLQVKLFQGVGLGTVQVELSNFSENTLQVLRWDTPFEETLSHDMFLISSSGNAAPLAVPAEYIGRHVKRSLPTSADYFVLQPGESVTAQIAPAEHYLIENSESKSITFIGEFKFAVVSTAVRSHLAERKIEELEHQGVRSNSVVIDLTPPVHGRARPADFNQCSSSEQAYIQSATEQAEILTNVAIEDLQSLMVAQRFSSPRYSNWFGSYNASRFDRVLNNFISISTALENETIRFDCTCTERGVFAYVYTARPYDIYLCPVFHAVAETGTDSRAGTIIHELSHFNILAGTDDHVYSQTGAQNLALSDPDRAVDNADSHEYFAENTPMLAIVDSNDASPVTIDFTDLDTDTVLSDSVASGEEHVYRANNVEGVELTSLSGDADLYIYANLDHSETICQSLLVTTIDQCDVPTNDTVYIVVAGYSDASYSLLATSSIVDVAETEPEPITVTELEAGPQEETEPDIGLIDVETVVDPQVPSDNDDPIDTDTGIVVQSDLEDQPESTDPAENPFQPIDDGSAVAGGDSSDDVSVNSGGSAGGGALGLIWFFVLLMFACRCNSCLLRQESI